MKKVKKTLYIVPGNPGNADFYARFCEALVSGSSEQSDVRVHCVGHVGHVGARRDNLVDLGVAERCAEMDEELRRDEGGGENGARGGRGGETTASDGDWPMTRDVGLEKQVEHHRRYIEKFILRRGDEEDVTIIGHSIGAWIANEALRRAIMARCSASRATATRSLRLVMLMPFLEADVAQPRQRLVSIVSSSPLLRSIAWLLVWLLRSLVPTTLREAILAKALSPTMCATSVALAARTIASTPSFISNALLLARDEFLELGRHDRWMKTLLELREERRRDGSDEHEGTSRRSKREATPLSLQPLRCTAVSFLYAKDDDWAPIPMLDKVTRSLGGEADVFVDYDDALSHGFCTNKREALKCATWVLERIAMDSTTATESVQG